MEEKQSGDCFDILVLVRTPLDPSRTRLLKKMLSRPQNGAVLLNPTIEWEKTPEERVFRLDEKGFSWPEFYDLVRRSPRILTLS
ncbi:MAG: hypothetical protein M1297_00120 [Nitrospirae bacterium]|jgi:peptide deformylase|nr:hypothetical protein [Nitrospirota bacterium]